MVQNIPLAKEMKQIPKDELREGAYYVGRGRNGNVGMWDGHHFLVISSKFDKWVVKVEPYFEQYEGCFQPFKLVDQGVQTDAWGAGPWDRHYCRQVEFDSGPDPTNIHDLDKLAAFNERVEKNRKAKSG